MFAKSLDEDSAMVVATIYDPYQVGHAYAVGDYFTYGVNGVGDPQLYKVVQAHTSQADWKPDALPCSLHADWPDPLRLPCVDSANRRS